MTEVPTNLDDPETNELWLRETLDKTIFDMLTDPQRSAKIDPMAPFPHWFKRTIQKAWIKHERERRAAKELQ